MPHPSLDSFFDINAGSESVEAALRTVRGITHKQNVITTYQGTFGAMVMKSNLSKAIYAHCFLPPMMRSCPFPPGMFLTDVGVGC